MVSFYAAMHYVNAFLWERLNVEPANHRERELFVATISTLRIVSADYRRLFAAAFLARYEPRYRIPNPRESASILTSLESIRLAIIDALETDIEA